MRTEPNWLDMLAYRLFRWRWNRVFRANHASNATWCLKLQKWYERQRLDQAVKETQAGTTTIVTAPPGLIQTGQTVMREKSGRCRECGKPEPSNLTGSLTLDGRRYTVCATPVPDGELPTTTD